MSELEQGGYQTAPEQGIENQGQIDNSQQGQAQEIQSPPQDNVFTVKYNKEEIQVPYDQAPDYIQKGLNYDKVQTRATEYENHLNRVAQLSGYQSHDEMIQALDEIERQQREQEYRNAGIDPDVLNKYLENHPDIQFAREMKRKQEDDARFNAEAGAFFQAFPDVQPKDIPPEVWQIQAQEGLPLVHAYRSYMFDNVRQNAEQQAIRNIQTNAQSSPGSLGGGDVNHNTNISSLSSKDFGSLVDQVLRGERKQL